MMNMFNVLEIGCESVNATFGAVIRAAILIIKIGIPIVLIIMGMMDLGKAVTSQKEDEMKKAQSLLIKRVIYAVLVFMVVQIVQFAFGILGNDGTDNDTAISCIGTLINGNG